jgi:Anti-sigma-K factor rskA
VAEDHERIEELLAGFVLRALPDDDAAVADRMLTEHVPSCPACRDTLVVFRGVTAQLALAAAPSWPPDTLLARLHRELRSPARRRPGRFVAVAAGFAAIVGLSGLAVSQGVRADGLQERAHHLTGMMSLASRPEARVVPMDGEAAPLTEVAAPGTEVFYLFGRDVEDPPVGMVYGVWLVAGSRATAIGTFVPDDGVVTLRLAFDPTAYDEVVVTIEPEGVAPGEPDEVVWRAAG